MKTVYLCDNTWCAVQGCQISLGTKCQNGKNIPNNHKIYQMATKYTMYVNSRKMFQMAITYNNIFHSKTKCTQMSEGIADFPSNTKFVLYVEDPLANIFHSNFFFEKMNCSGVSDFPRQSFILHENVDKRNVRQIHLRLRSESENRFVVATCDFSARFSFTAMRFCKLLPCK
jgi:hypothetical protein